MPTVIPFHLAVIDDPAFAPSDPAIPFSVHTRWIETEFDNRVEPYSGPVEQDGAPEREPVTVEVGGKRLEVVLPAELGAAGSAPGRPQGRRASRRGGGGTGGTAAAAGGDALVSPMQGTVVKVVAEDGATVAEGDPVIVIEAMKMEQPLTAHKAGVVSGLAMAPGDGLSNGGVVCEIKDA